MSPLSSRQAARSHVAHRVREMVLTAAVEVFGADRRDEPIEGFSVLTASRIDDPLNGMRAAHLITRVAEGQRAEFASDARAAGRSWDEIGEALDLPVDRDRSRAEAAFVWLVEGRSPDVAGPAGGFFRTPTTWWRCGTCGERVADRGPFESHPDDNEDGHADDCTRRRTALTEYRQWIEEDQ